jgi:hypothetical protein
VGQKELARSARKAEEATTGRPGPEHITARHGAALHGVRTAAHGSGSSRDTNPWLLPVICLNDYSNQLQNQKNEAEFF